MRYLQVLTTSNSLLIIVICFLITVTNPPIRSAFDQMKCAREIDNLPLWASKTLCLLVSNSPFASELIISISRELLTAATKHKSQVSSQFMVYLSRRKRRKIHHVDYDITNSSFSVLLYAHSQLKTAENRIRGFSHSIRHKARRLLIFNLYLVLVFIDDRNTVHKQKCFPCDFQFTTPEDYGKKRWNEKKNKNIAQKKVKMDWNQPIQTISLSRLTCTVLSNSVWMCTALAEKLKNLLHFIVQFHRFYVL